MCLHLKLGLGFKRVFMDTGWEHPDTLAYLRGPLTEKLGPITELRAPRQMEELVKHYATFPGRRMKFCTRELKVKPMKKFITQLMDEGRDVINSVGVRAQESSARSKLEEWEWQRDFDCWLWRPLIQWSEQDVIDMHKRHGLQPNPLYLRGAGRVGCWPCINSRKTEIRFMAEQDPARVDHIRKLEAEVAEIAKERYAARGETFESRGHTPPAFFEDRFGGFGFIPIDDMVAWARTKYGGKELDDVPMPDGCVRWGMCEGVNND